VRPRRLTGVVVRPLNFTVRGHPVRRMRKLIRLLGLWLIASLMAAVFARLWTWPWHPHSVLGWCVFLIGALPVTGAGEYLFDRLIFRSRPGTRLDALGSGVSPSALRIAYVLVCVIVIAAVLICAFAWLNRTGWLGAL
jgi:hypothetical protein